MDTHPHVNSIKNTQNNIQHNISNQHKISAQLGSIRHGKAQLGSIRLNNCTNVSYLVKPHLITNSIVNNQYIGNAMRNAVVNNRRVMVCSDMGTGKTYGMADAIKDAIPNGVVIVVTHLRSLVRGNEARLKALLL